MRTDRLARAGLASAAALLSAGFALLFLGRGETAPRSVPRSPVSAEAALDRARRAESYARWVLSRAGSDLTAVAAARRAVRGALADWEAHAAAEPELSARLAGVRLDLEGRYREGLERLWVSYRRNRALRDWRGARRDLSLILSVAPDPRDADHRQARQLLNRLATR